MSRSIETDDPDALGEALRGIGPSLDRSSNPATFKTVGERHGPAYAFALSELHRVAPAPTDVIAPARRRTDRDAISVNVDGCTPCLSCVSVCPTGALPTIRNGPYSNLSKMPACSADCQSSTCPEKVITPRPQIDFRAAAARAQIIKEEEPALCIRCNKPFGVKSTIDRIAAKLEGRHWIIPPATNGWTW